jgi:hypothetical protein
MNKVETQRISELFSQSTQLKRKNEFRISQVRIAE